MELMSAKASAQPQPSERWSAMGAELEILDEDGVSWTNALFTRNTAVNLQLDGRMYQFSLLPIVSPECRRKYKPAVVASISTNEHSFRVAVEDISFIGNMEPGQLPPEVVCAIFELNLDALLSSLEQRLESPLKIERVEIAPQELPGCDSELFFRLKDDTSGLSGLGSFLLDRGSLAWLARVYSDHLPLPVIPGYRNLPVRIGFIAGRTRLAGCHVKDLGIGDIIFAQSGLGSKTETITAAIQGKPMWECRAGVEGFTILYPVEEKMDEEKIEMESAEQSKTDFESLDMDIEFHIGSLKMPLSRLKSVQQGFVFDLNKKTENYIVVRANGSPIARGELVRVGQRLGVRVTELLLTKG